MNRKTVTIIVAGCMTAIALIAVVAFVLSGQRVRRHPMFRPSPAAVPPAAKIKKRQGVPAPEQWTGEFERLKPVDLDDLLDRIESKRPDLYGNWSLAYLHARARLEQNDLPGAQAKLAPFLTEGNALRDLALFHQAEIDDAANNPKAASSHRSALIFGYPSSPYREQAIEDELEYLSTGPPSPLLAFTARLNNSATAARRRDFEARVIEALLRTGDVSAGMARALALLGSGTMDDASDRASRALDKPELIRHLTPAQWVILGETFRNHRHFDRAVALLSLALPRLTQKRDDLTFAIGRSYFGNEQYALAQQTYLRGAGGASLPQRKTEFLWHAARAAQLAGDDAGAERLMTASIAVPGRWPSALAALTQRIRTRLVQHRVGEAAADLQQLRILAPNNHAIADGALAYGLAMTGAGNGPAAIAALNSVSPKLLDEWDRPEFAYWRARALESSDSHAAFQSYLAVLRANVPTHFAYFARQRLDAPAMASRLSQEVAARDAQVAQLIAAKNFVKAKDVETDRILLSSRDRTRALAMLTSIYRQLPAYRAVMELKPAAMPQFPLPARSSSAIAPAFPDLNAGAARGASAPAGNSEQPAVVKQIPARASAKNAKGSHTAKATHRAGQARPAKPSHRSASKASPARLAASVPQPLPPVPRAQAERASLLLAMGLYDEASDEIVRRFPLHPLSSALTQSSALNRGNASKQSILAIEIMMKSVPQDFVPDLLPGTVRQLLYPRYFYGFISEDSKKYGADPALVLSIMREESRFNPRAKSEAAARGLLQFIITTARDIGRDIGLVNVTADELYDPRVIIRLGARYMATLSRTFADDHYKVAGAYNAGPKQVALWSRLSPGPGDDFFLSSINFGETKHYVRKVMNSYRRYSEIYGDAGPQGGLRAEP